MNRILPNPKTKTVTKIIKLPNKKSRTLKLLFKKLETATDNQSMRYEQAQQTDGLPLLESFICWLK